MPKKRKSATKAKAAKKTPLAARLGYGAAPEPAAAVPNLMGLTGSELEHAAAKVFNMAMEQAGVQSGTAAAGMLSDMRAILTDVMGSGEGGDGPPPLEELSGGGGPPALEALGGADGPPQLEALSDGPGRSVSEDDGPPPLEGLKGDDGPPALEPLERKVRSVGRWVVWWMRAVGDGP